MKAIKLIIPVFIFLYINTSYSSEREFRDFEKQAKRVEKLLQKAFDKRDLEQAAKLSIKLCNTFGIPFKYYPSNEEEGDFCVAVHAKIKELDTEGSLICLSQKAEFDSKRAVAKETDNKINQGGIDWMKGLNAEKNKKRKQKQKKQNKELLNKNLVQAVFSDDTKLSVDLIERGADVNVKIEDCSLLHISIKNSNFEVTKKLLEFDADPHFATGLGITPLHRAVGPCREDKINERKKIIELLVQYIDNLETKTFTHGYTPLHVAAAHGNLEFVQILIDNNADYLAKTYDKIYEGKMAIELAEKNGHSQVAMLLANVMYK